MKIGLQNRTRVTPIEGNVQVQRVWSTTAIISMNLNDFENGTIEVKMYSQLLQGDDSRKVIVDLAIPNNVSEETSSQFNMDYIEIDGLKVLAKKKFLKTSRVNLVSHVSLKVT